MNIFFLDQSPILSAKHHCDKHVVKMIVESAQLLSNAHYIYGCLDDKLLLKIYNPTHLNHPCTKFVASCTGAYEWVYFLFRALLNEYTIRYNKIHKCYDLLDFLKYLPRDIECKHMFALTDVPQAMPEYLKIIGDPVSAYRMYYMFEKSKFAKWKNGNIPHWYKI